MGAGPLARSAGPLMREMFLPSSPEAVTAANATRNAVIGPWIMAAGVSTVDTLQAAGT